jgi:pimeloyl-ACP methyl ester carboxylesterase
MYVEEEPGREPATVWLHHGVGSTQAWQSLLPAAAGGRRAIAYDRRGFGRSSHERRFTTAMFDEDVDDLRELITRRGGRPVHLIGHSDGGTIALLLAARSPELVLSAAVVAVHVRGDQVTVATLRRMGPPDKWPEPMRRNLQRAHGEDWFDVAGRWHALWTSPGWERWSIVDELASITAPVYAMHGLHDSLSPALHAETLHGRLPASRIAWVDTASHEPHRADPERFVTDLQTLWQDAEGADD